MKRITLILITLFSLSTIGNACGVDGIAYGRISNANPIAIMWLKPRIAVISETNFTVSVNPFGYYEFPVQPCIQYQIIPQTKMPANFSPASYTIVGGQGDFFDLNFALL